MLVSKEGSGLTKTEGLGGQGERNVTFVILSWVSWAQLFLKNCRHLRRAWTLQLRAVR